MKELVTEIEIDARPEEVWRVLTDFATYPTWSSFISSIEGDPQEGSRLRVVLTPPGKKSNTFTPVVLAARTGREFRWRGRVPLLFYGEHYFRLMPSGGGRTKFTHGEKFTGPLVPFMARSLDIAVRAGFEAFNREIKQRTESFKGKT